ncbi:MAG TPA: imidazole glycerol phosphate synthase subunit HisH [Bryobacteraceae bacterium]|nr:imidazole glycerol phosphate synthase subunit HisH [Bryobacteraceae bacterium]
MTATVALIDYGSGNLRSAEKALARATAEAGSGHAIVVTADPNQVGAAERIVLPGVGAFADCMRGVSSIPGMVEALEDSVLKRGAPFLGICVGMQLLAEVGREHGDHKGLGWIPGEVVRLEPAEPALKVPHMGWNSLSILQPHVLLAGITDGADFYFVHSYYLRPKNPAHILATTDYAGSIPAIIGRDNIAGTQFHPEKSQAEGLVFLQRFLKWRP